MGFSPEEIQRELPHLNLAQVFDAIAFYFDHKEMIDQDLVINKITDLIAQFLSFFDLTHRVSPKIPHPLFL
jgi:hypothetical protein